MPDGISTRSMSGIEITESNVSSFGYKCASTPSSLCNCIFGQCITENEQRWCGSLEGTFLGQAGSDPHRIQEKLAGQGLGPGRGLPHRLVLRKVVARQAICTIVSRASWSVSKRGFKYPRLHPPSWRGGRACLRNRWLEEKP